MAHAPRKAFKGCCAHHLWRLCQREELQGAEWGNLYRINGNVPFKFQGNVAGNSY